MRKIKRRRAHLLLLVKFIFWWSSSRNWIAILLNDDHKLKLTGGQSIFSVSLCAIYTRDRQIRPRSAMCWKTGGCAFIHSFEYEKQTELNWTTDKLFHFIWQTMASCSIKAAAAATGALLQSLNLWLLFFGSPPVSWTLSGEEKKQTFSGAPGHSNDTDDHWHWHWWCNTCQVTFESDLLFHLFSPPLHNVEQEQC